LSRFQAEALAEEQDRVFDEQARQTDERLATKAEIAALRSETQMNKVDLTRAMAEMKVDILKWTFGMLVAAIGVVVALEKLLGH
jgi:hypothetical protein